VAFIGRSIEDKTDIAKKLGFLSYPQDLVIPIKKATKLSKEKVMFVISGSYGQPGSALDRVSRGDHDFLSADEGDTVIFSSDPAPPGSKASVDAVVDRLLDMNVDVHYYDLQEDLHVSGHGSMGDIKMLFSIIKPKYFVPIGGTIRHNRGYRNIAEDMGNDPNNVFELTPGEVVEFENGSATKGKKVQSEHVLVDGLGIGDVGNVVLRDRHRLSQDGVVIVLIKIDKPAGKLIDDPEVISRGFVFERQKKGFLEHSARLLRQKIEKGKKVSKDTARTDAIDFLEKFFWEETRRRPMILPVVVEV
jgi:ribonuclease J